MGLNKGIVDWLFARFYPGHRYSEPQIGRALGFDFKPGMRLLDAGCGGGWHYNYREQLKGAYAVGMDLSDSHHVLYNRINGRHEDNICPVCYRANSRKTIARIAAESGFVIDTNEVVECEPIYFRPFFPLYLLGILYERLVNMTPMLEDQRCTIVSRLKRA